MSVGQSVARMVVRSFIISQKGGKLHFHAPIDAFKILNDRFVKDLLLKDTFFGENL